ncbi:MULTISPECIES: OmpA family protein [unclassified Pseudomonas]|uniref:OmpA family protein n=1 Tax=unclassified Pseudomonas TaxID=196821 RepID=UPI000C888E02|nr:MULTISPECIES: OmpA family protein [unclassified Pseudomonas]PMZ85166.1 flagellar motor protein MotB [Pseudomonas sp. FW215-T2]PNA06645.1 flagellar motor protein MotB [Pseudomonas sp. FW215-R3]PNB33113.1 flagellar motor protein MotB [Pseudomonas sp. FW305-131]
MTLKLKQGLWLWAGALALMLLVIIPLGGWGRVTVAMIVVGCVALACVRAARQRQLLGSVDNLTLPPAAYRHPVVMVCGDGLAGLFGGSCTDHPALRLTEQGCYLRVSRAEQLPGLIDTVMALRPEWGGQLSVMFIVNPGEHSDAAVLAGQVRTFSYQAGLIRKRGIALPLILVSYLQSSASKEAWFSWEAGQGHCNIRQAGACLMPNDWHRLPADNATCTLRLQASIQLNSAAAWLDEYVLPHFATREDRLPAGLPLVCASTFVSTLPGYMTGNLWQQWLRGKTGLLDTDAQVQALDAPLPFPDPLLNLLPVQARHLPMRRASVIALWLFAVAAIVALTSSAWQNTLLLRQVSDDLLRYASIAPTERRDQPEFALREEALSVLREDAVRLDSYYRQGEPLALGLGLYRGEQLRAGLLSTIANHRQPSVAPMPARTARTVRLDSLSLFSSASAQLKPESTKVLIDALVGIKAQPGWLIVIAGHTDAVGSDEHNLQLSRARAAAVREWMQRMGGIPDSCFAVQGFGKSQPIASNDTEAGRQANRRVDIRLVPEVGACALPTAGADVHPPVANAAFLVLRKGASHGNSHTPVADR